ncbi:PQQ-dependent sugar dehydrogenase [Botrimarina hoheduenensis]|uniref:Quinoprotein glucose dehydrogenase B n=1 Tax=Botrimarina hoheduenensis TaxID=2528000 RepID=A0A5C5WEQ7_9BACT|nr:PQQ-dependent sugar dehydrogenase [Botrimarina hoheduenensis]TWT48583.1 Quinoprotein glucose dehydrogenase B precursor [Botrimarina hoheduenensis]
MMANTRVPQILGALASGLVVLITAAVSQAEITGVTRIASLPGTGARAVYATHAPGRPNDLFVVDQRGLVQLLDLTTGTYAPQPFLNISGLVDDAANEQGLLGLAFDPDYETNGYFYVNYTRDPGPGLDRTRIDRYQAASPLTDSVVSAVTRNSVLEFDQDFDNHNGGWIGFSPIDNYLYIATGDGGSGNDPNNRAQSLNTRLGKMLRVDVSGDDFPTDTIENYAVPSDNPFVGDGLPGTLDEIWSYGLRNPWRASFDRQTGDLWIGDVGQGAREEINRLPVGAGVANFGWRLREGDVQTPGSAGGPIPPNYVAPVYDYLSNGSGLFGGNSTVGGYVYRGPDPEVQGRYFFGDSFPAQLWTFDPANPDSTVQNVEATLGGGVISTPVSFAEDAIGNLYILDLGGSIYRIDTDALRTGDYNGDGAIDEQDYAFWAASFGSTTDLGADGNGDLVIDLADYTVWRDAAGVAIGSAVPEPSTAVVLLSSLIALAARSRVPLAR